VLTTELYQDVNRLIPEWLAKELHLLLQPKRKLKKLRALPNKKRFGLRNGLIIQANMG